MSPGRQIHQSKTCGLCGERPATTRDHLPPKGLFALPLPPNLITVPACTQCNHEGSKFDDEFQAYLAIHVGGKSASGDQFFAQRAKSSILKNRKRSRIMLSRMKRVNVMTDSGLFLGKTPAILWDGDAHDLVVARMIRGLYWHHTGQILPRSVEVTAHWYKAIKKEMVLPFLVVKGEHAGVRKIGGDQFSYGFLFDPAGSGHSVWLFQFHRAHACGGTTRPTSSKSPAIDPFEPGSAPSDLDLTAPSGGHSSEL